MRRKLILTGPLAGKTIRLRNRRFINGVLLLDGAPEAWEGVVRYMGRCYQAFEEGTAALLEAQARDEALRVEYQKLCELYRVKMQKDAGGRPDPFSRHAAQLRAYHQEKTNGQCEVLSPPESGPAGAPPGQVQPAGGGPASRAADELRGDDDASGGDSGLRADGSVELGAAAAAPSSMGPLPASATLVKKRPVKI